MTNKQAEVCKAILEYGKLNPVLSATGLEDYDALNNVFMPYYTQEIDIDFRSDEDDPPVTISHKLLDAYETHLRAVLAGECAGTANRLSKSAVIIAGVALALEVIRLVLEIFGVI